MDAINNILTNSQVEILSTDILTDSLIKLKELIDDDQELEDLEDFEIAILNKIKAILCTLTNDTYENIVKVVRDKLNLDDLFDNRQKYLN
jgi:hypothetical protein